MKLGEPVANFTPPLHPKGIALHGSLVALKPLNAAQYAEQLFAANSLDKEGKNWLYLPYGPFLTLADYHHWLKTLEQEDDPTFLVIISKQLQQAIGIASYLRIDPSMGCIEVGHINFSPLLQRTTAATEAMYLMMQWAFENGYRRYEWKCNALNEKSCQAAQRLGLSYEGIFRQANIVKGRNRDTAWFAAIDKEWDNLKQCFKQYLSDDNFDQQGKAIISLSSLTQPLLYKTK